MKRGMLLCVALAGALGCEKDETLPEPVAAESSSRKPSKKSKDPEPGESASPDATPPAPTIPSSCTPQAGEVCLVGAELEHAVVLLHHVTGANVVVVGSYDKRIDGVISTVNASAAIETLAKQAELVHVEMGGIHYLGSDTVISRGGGGAGDFCRERMTLVAQRTNPEELIKQVVEGAGRRLQGSIEGEVTVAVSNVSGCVMAQQLVHFSGGRSQVDAKALRLTGDAALPKSTRAAGTPCAPLDTDKVLRQPCHKTVDLAVVGVGRVGDADVAVVRRTGRVFEPVELVKAGEHIGDYHQEVGGIDASGIKSKGGTAIVIWSP